MRALCEWIAGVYGVVDGVLLALWAGLTRLCSLLLGPVRRYVRPIARRLWQRGGVPFVRKLRSLSCTVANGFDRIPLVFRLTCLPLAALAGTLVLWRIERTSFLVFMGFPDYEAPRLLAQQSILIHLVTLERLAPLVAALAAAASVFAFWRHAIALWLLKISAAGYALFVLLLLTFAWRAPAILHWLDPDLFDGPARNEVWVRATVRLFPLALLAVLFLFVLLLRAICSRYQDNTQMFPAWGDRVWNSLRSHGKEPRYRKAQYASFWIHVFCILILPFILSWGGCRMQPYGVPKGSGVTAVQVVQVVQQQEQEVERKYVFDMDTAISFYVPKIDESEVFDQVTRMTEHTYTAQEVGRLGAGGGTSGGWPNGMENARVRFIRLQYSGGSWDQNMGYGGDFNMLLAFRNLTGFNIWHETESIRVGDLRRFPRRRAPPFVYLAGGYQGGVTLSQSDIRTLRDYCLNMGGMIFADNGGGQFDRQFRNAMRQVFPDLPMVEIPHDDVIFQAPFRFPRGAPPLWQISGTQAMGIRYRGRWVVFYHQGNLGAAWRDGHSDASPAVVSQAYQLGVNVIAYAFNQYMQINFGGSIPR